MNIIKCNYFIILLFYMNTILVTGGCGYIGSHACVELLNQYNVIVIDNFSNSSKKVIEKIEKITNNKVKLYEFDLLNEEKIDKVFNENKIDYVIHFAGLKSVSESVSNPLKYYKNNLCSTLNLIEIMEKYGCYNLIFSSSATVYGNSISPLSENSKVGIGITNPYGQTKYMIEQILEDVCKSNKNFNIISLRYFNPIGCHKSGLIGENPNDIPNNLMPYILKVAIQNNTEYHINKKYNHLNIFGNDYDTKDGTCIRDYIHVIDLVKGHVKALNHLRKGYHAYNLGTGQGTSVNELVDCFITINNVILPYKYIDRRDGDLETVFCNPNKAFNELGWKAELTIKDMCKDTWRFQLLNPLGY